MQTQTSRRSCAVLAAWVLVLAQPREAKAENDLSYHYEEYREAGRITVRSQGAQAEQDLGTDMRVKIGGVIDSIAGATPTGEPAPAGSDQVILSHLSDLRRAWNAEVSKQLPRVNVALGFSRSVEHDYASNGWSINTLTDFNQKNTTVLLGVAGTDDNVEVFFKPAWLRKVSNDVIAGVTQLIDPRTSVTADLTWGRETGFLNDQYKLVEKDIQILPGIFLPETFAENRPNERTKVVAFLSVNRAFPGAKGALEASYRFYHDTYGISAHTLDLAWFQQLSDRVVLRLSVRPYQQDAAGFYHYRLNDTPLIPTSFPNPQGPFYSSDGRLSALRSLDCGLKAVWTAAAWLQLGAEVSRYTQRGTDGVIPQSAYYRATVTSASARLSW